MWTEAGLAPSTNACSIRAGAACSELALCSRSYSLPDSLAAMLLATLRHSSCISTHAPQQPGLLAQHGRYDLDRRDDLLIALSACEAISATVDKYSKTVIAM